MGRSMVKWIELGEGSIIDKVSMAGESFSKSKGIGCVDSLLEEELD